MSYADRTPAEILAAARAGEPVPPAVLRQLARMVGQPLTFADWLATDPQVRRPWRVPAAVAYRCALYAREAANVRTVAGVR